MMGAVDSSSRTAGFGRDRYSEGRCSVCCLDLRPGTTGNHWEPPTGSTPPVPTQALGSSRGPLGPRSHRHLVVC
ncbi:hypothetical protein NHX12_006219 [Muraenolepis orangiensis]|uniref:Uncharacterized protein n=1 Tax=Muraenolepis orangiensis TaxID=630683 RepID=A0A9Q0DSW9_9TELE|nr:hypothetical protein NHX12_006219 [Muraenolepis orangiensis]